MLKRARGDSRGLSTIVATLLIILLTLVAVGIIWVVVRNVINQGSEQVSLGKFTIDLEIKDVVIDPSISNFFSLTVRRNSGEGDILGLKFIIDDDNTAEVFELNNFSIKELEQRIINVSLKSIENASSIKKISVVPIFKLDSGKEIIGDVKDEYEIPKSSIISGGITCFPNCIGRNCGLNGCGGICGTCSSGVCDVSGQCVSSSPPVWQSGMVSWWRFEGNANDYLGKYNGTVSGVINYIPGKIGQAASGFSQSNKININPSLDYASTSVTISFWLYFAGFLNPVEEQHILGKTKIDDGAIVALSGGPEGAVGFYYGPNAFPNAASSSFGLTAGRWEHWAVTRDKTSRVIQWYKNGVPACSPQHYNPEYTPAHNSTNNFTIGYGGVDPLNGYIDEIMIFNRSLSSTEISQIYSYSYP